MYIFRCLLKDYCQNDGMQAIVRNHYQTSTLSTHSNFATLLESIKLSKSTHNYSMIVTVS